MGIAHELITRGWHQGAYEGPDGSVCLMGAAECVAFGRVAFRRGVHGRLSSGEWRERGRVLEALQAVVGEMHVSDFNDAPGRTFDEVLRVAKQADEILDTP